MVKKLLCAGLLCMLICGSQAAPQTKAPEKATGFDVAKCTLLGKTQQNKFLYAPGEEMVFLVEFDAGKQSIPEKYTLRIDRFGDDGLKKTEQFDLAKVTAPVRFTTSASQPGFVRIIASIRDEKGKKIGKAQQTFEGGAGVEIDKLKPAAQEPADFDAFWDKQKKRLDAVPVKAERKLVSKPDAPVLVYAVKIDCAGPRPVTGYMTVPANAREKSMHIQVNYQGYGTGVQRVPAGKDKSKIVFTINAHGYEFDQSKEYYADFFSKIKSNGKIYAFDPQQNSDPEQAYFNGMALRVMRSLQYVKSLPEWNGKTLAVAGGSQGGLQTMWAAALDKDVTDAFPNVTWCCDLAGHSKIKRLNGWRPRYVAALDYYDPVFHARRIKCRVNITRAGLGDYVCPPSGLAISYNELKCPKSIEWVQGSTHGYVQKGAQRFKMSSGAGK
jgi:cephalosporin-C deacetylase-like acetyl esterase